MEAGVKRAIVLVLDGCGAGEAPDAPLFGDFDHPATVRHVWEHCGGLSAPNLKRAGFLSACGVPVAPGERARYGRLRERSMGKDSVTGHWEMMGIMTPKPFPTYPRGFPADLVGSFEKAIGRQVIGNRPASGTQIIEELGGEHVLTGKPILYTSADSVFQIACHEDVIPIEELYSMCRTARELCSPPHNVQRVIARPFIGSAGAFVRTEHRKDFPLVAPRNAIDQIGDVLGVGVIPELFGGRGFRPSRRTQNNAEHALALQEALESDARFIFANFEDFDMLYGHRNDPSGFGRALETFDQILGATIEQLGPEDVLFLSADHGNDPTSRSTDHSREYVPICMISVNQAPEAFGDVAGMNAVGYSVLRHLGIEPEFEATCLL
jgi:phosphopentomutase